MQYINNIIIPYVENVQMLLSDKKPAFIIMVTLEVKSHPLSVFFLKTMTSMCTCCHPDLLQPMDISVNKRAKDFLRGKLRTLSKL